MVVPLLLLVLLYRAREGSFHGSSVDPVTSSVGLSGTPEEKLQLTSENEISRSFGLLSIPTFRPILGIGVKTRSKVVD